MHVIRTTTDLLAILVALSALTYWLAPEPGVKRGALWVGFIAGCGLVWVMLLTGVWTVYS